MFGMGPFSSAPFSSMPRFPYIVPAAHTKEGKERLRAYYEALGRFVDMFARVEIAMTLTLWHYSKTAPEIAKIVHAGTKIIDTGAGYIKQLTVATNISKELQDDLTDVVDQLNAINSVRNLILHYGATSVAEGRAIVSNAYKAKGEPKSFPISPTDLDNMTGDLKKIAAHLNERHLGKRSEYTLLGNPIHDAWRYIRPSPKKVRSTKAERRRAKKPRPKPPAQPQS